MVTTCRRYRLAGGFSFPIFLRHCEQKHPWSTLNSFVPHLIQVRTSSFIAITSVLPELLAINHVIGGSDIGVR